MDFDALSEEEKKQRGRDYAGCLSPRLMAVLGCLRHSKFPIDLRTKLVPANDWELGKTGAVSLIPVKPKWFGKLEQRGYVLGTFKEARLSELGEAVLAGAEYLDQIQKDPLAQNTKPFVLINRDTVAFNPGDDLTKLCKKQEAVVFTSENTPELDK